MSQTEMLPIVFPCQEAERLQRELTEERWRCHLFNTGQTGELTLEQIRANNHPNWQWGDYAI